MACNDVNNVQLNTEYYPMVNGYQRIYQARQTSYVGGTATDTTFFWRETLLDTLDGSGNSYVRIETRPTTADSWSSYRFDRVRKTVHFLEIQSDNEPLAVLNFPVQEGRSWDANVLNGDTLVATRRYESLSGSDFRFNNLAHHIKVVIADLPVNIVERDDRIEIYSEQIGLVKRSFFQYTFCLENCSGENEIADGFSLDLQLLDTTYVR